MQAVGGKGANQAVAAYRLGGEVSFITCLGNDVNGENTLQYYQNEGLDISSSLIAVYPNPVSDVAYLKNDFDGHLQIVTTEGRVVYNSYHIKGDTLDLAATKTRVYILKLTDKRKNISTTVFSKN
jgi:sugar/nucleoside kinase (ribokinase family)